MTPTSGRQMLLATVSEEQWLMQIREWADRTGWMAYHTHDSRRSTPGFPDLVLVKPPRVLFVEAKTVRGRLSLPQTVWMGVLANCPGVSYFVWRPTDEAEVRAVLGVR